jgi:putative NADH-flavin reductase
MRLAIFGATGGTGSRLVRQALESGHQVTAVVRGHPQVIATELTPAAHEHLTIVQADVMDPAAIEPIVADQDAVLSAIGTRDGRKPTTVCADSMVSIITAMDKAGARRLIVVSADGAFTDETDGPGIRLIAKPLLQRILKHSFADVRTMEELIRGSGLDWTIMRSPRLTDGPRTRGYRTAVDQGLRRGYRISRADLADCMLGLIDDSDFHRTTVWIGY